MFRYCLLVLILLVACATDAPAPVQPLPDDSAASAEPAEEQPGAAEILESVYSGSSDSLAALQVLEDSGIESMDAESRLIYAVLLMNEGMPGKARAQLEQLIQEDGQMAAAWYNLALTEHAAGNREARDTALEAALNADSQMPEVYAFRGRLAIEDSNWIQAEVHFKQALEIAPESVESLTGMAWVMAKTDRLEDALPLLDRAVETAPEYVYARVDRSRVNVSLRNYSEAEEDLDFVIEHEPDVPWHYLDRARIRLRYFKEYDGALSDLEQVERLDPDNFFAMVYLAGLHDEERRFATAWEYYQKVLEMRPDYVWAYKPMGKFAYIDGDFASAADWFLKAAAEDPEDFTLSLAAGVSLYRAGQTREAGRLFADLLKEFDQGSAGYEVVRFCMERGSDYHAVNALNREESEIRRERLWFYMGAMYESEGNTASSQAVFQRLSGRIGHMEFDLAWAAMNGWGE